MIGVSLYRDVIPNLEAAQLTGYASYETGALHGRLHFSLTVPVWLAMFLLKLKAKVKR